MRRWDFENPDGTGGGSGGGGGVSTSDARNIEYGRLLLAMGEGPWLGIVGDDGVKDALKSIFLNQTPIMAADGSFNFKGVSVAMTTGTNTQAMIPKTGTVESPTTVNVKVTFASPHTETIATSGLSAVRVNIKIPVLKHIDSTTGAESGVSVTVKIERQRTGYNGGAYETVTLDQAGVISGKFGSPYVKGYRIELPNTGSGAWSIRVTRMTADHTSGAPDYTGDETWWDTYSELTDARLRYPNTAMLAVMVDAKQFSSVPNVAVDVYMRQVLVPSNYEPATRTYNTTGFGTTGGLWDGTFGDRATSTVNAKVWTDNPAWQFYDLATDTRAGAGNFLDAAKMDKWSLYAISQICDQMVDDGHGGTEPRFVCNLFIQAQEDAIKVLSHMASAFRAMAYWAGGQVTAVQDVDANPVAIFTNANVHEGAFSYEGTARKARHTAALVGWIDPNQGYKSAVEYVEDAPGIARYGYNPAQVQGFGITSQGQARRLGLSVILAEILQTEVVSFATGMEGVTLRPGNVIQIQDEFRAGLTRMGGRVGTGSTTTVIVLDAPVTLGGGTYTLKCKMPDGTVESKTVSTGVGTTSTITVGSAFSVAPESTWILQTGTTQALYRVIGIRESDPLKYEVSALLHDPTKYSLIETGLNITNDGPAGTSAFPPVTALTLAAPVTVLNDRQVTNLTAYWTAPTIVAGAPTVSGYIAEYSRDFLPWIPMVVNAAAAESVDVIPGAYRVRVTVKYPTGISAPTNGTITVGDTAGSDDYVGPTRKHEIKSEWTRIKVEQVLLDAQATAAGVTTEKTTYDTAITTLYTFLDGQVDTDATDAWAGSTSTGDWLDYTLTCYLGAGGGATLRADISAVWAARDALVLAIQTVALVPADAAPADTFRPALVWDLGDGSDASWTLSGATSADSGSPYAKVGRAITSTGTDPQIISPAFSLTGKDARVIVARVRLVSGTWVGEAYFKGTSPSVGSFTTGNYKSVTTPVVGAWTDVHWDMANLTAGTTNYIANTAITQIRLDFCSTNGAVVDVDWIAVGTYGAGSKADYDLAVAQAATTAMQKADFLTGGKINGTTINDSTITSNLIAANTIFSKQMIVANFDNLIPNPNSEQVLTGMAAGGWEGIGISSAQARTGSKSRLISSTTTTITPFIPVAVGEQFLFTAYVKAASSSTIILKYYAADTTTVIATHTSTAKSGNVFTEQCTLQSTVPASAVFMIAQLQGGGTTYFDDLYLRRMADSLMIVDGGILANNIFAGAIQTYHISVGPNYQFTATAGATPLLMNADGTFSANNGTGAVENATDASTYMDAGRIYPSTRTKTFEANFSGTQERGFLINMSNAFTSNTVGLRILHSGTTITVQPVTSVRTYGSALTPTTTPSSVTTAGTGKLTAIFSGDSGTSSTRRLVIKLDGVEVQTYSDTAIGATNKGQQSGYAGLILGAHATRPGDVRVWGIALGIGSVTLQDGVVTADHLISDFATVNTIRSSNYTAGHADASHGGSGTGSPVGYKLAGTAFTTTYADGSTSASCQMEMAGDANFGGYKVTTVNDRVFQIVNRIQNMGFALALTPWGVSAGTGTPVWDSTTKTAGSGSAVITATASSPNTTTKTGSIYQSFSIPKPTSGQTVNLKFQMGEKTTSNTAVDYSGYVQAYILDFSTGTETAVGSSYSFDYLGTTATTVAWNLRTIDITSNVANGGDFMVRFEMQAYVSVSSGASSTTSTYVDEVSILG